MEWISVEDRLPEASKEFVCHHDGQVFSAVYDDVNNVWFIPSIGSNRVSYYLDVSHWMPLPEPPKK